MEDQPADSGDLTAGDETSEATDATSPRRRRFSLRRRPKVAQPEADSAAEPADEEPNPAPRVPMGKAARTKADEPTAETIDEPTVEAVEEPTGQEPAEPEVPRREVTFVAHRPADKRLVGAAVAAGVLFVGAAAFAGATLQPYLAERAEIDTKLDVARTAASAISTLWTYTPDNMETLPDRSAVFLGGDFAYEYRKYIDAIVAPNKQAQVTNTTQVLGAAVESLTPSEATAIVYTNSVATSPMTKNIPSLRYLSYRLTMERHDAKWLITRMSTVTSLDLTPQL
ncbi:MAG TPA: mammalian cell entry protein [Mycobacterium sp.]|nr:mammalian cell entry protein [Mycobacterium sp.]